ncbi:nucleotide sugar dehydrogenase [Candidatus Saccharibacteria bacterium]|nr:nucleotide sugar dehydrogenase [Candidatus Saccharibacteria bacterium]
MKIAIAGTGYVGLSLATLLSQNNEVVALDIIPEKVKMVNELVSPIQDEYIEKYFDEARRGERILNLRATLDWEEAFREADYVIIATPTDYDAEKDFFNTSSVEDIIEKVIALDNPKTTMVIKSTIPVGYVNAMRQKYGIDNIFFSPEFLREGRALYDNLYPSRIIVGSYSEEAQKFAELLQEASLAKDVQILMMNSNEAEAVKLFANTYLALRVAYFNELDTYAEIKGLDAKSIIDGVSLDPRIGVHYNNPSFGYGGYCLPKDTKQLLANYKGVPQDLIRAIVEANITRKKFITDEVLARGPELIGVYRLTMKSDSDNFRDAAIHDIIKNLKDKKKKILIYEPMFEGAESNGVEVTDNLKRFKKDCSVILANRMTPELEDIKDKVYTRDLFARD